MNFQEFQKKHSGAKIWMDTKKANYARKAPESPKKFRWATKRTVSDMQLQ